MAYIDVVRHAEDNEHGGLSNAGRAQAERVGAEYGLNYEVFLSSPLQRCTETAKALIAGTRATAAVEVVPWLTTMQGQAWNELLYSVAFASAIKECGHKWQAARRLAPDLIRGDASATLDAAVAYAYQCPPVHRIIAVSHGTLVGSVGQLAIAPLWVTTDSWVEIGHLVGVRLYVDPGAVSAVRIDLAVEGGQPVASPVSSARWVNKAIRFRSSRGSWHARS